MDRGCSSGRLDCLSMKAEGKRNDIVFFSGRGKIVMSNDQGLQRHRGRAEAWMPKKTCANDGYCVKMNTVIFFWVVFRKQPIVRSHLLFQRVLECRLS